MNRDEFEKAYADKYTAGDVSAVFANRDFKRYTDHHIDLCWKVQQVKDVPMGRNCIGDTIIKLAELEW